MELGKLTVVSVSFSKINSERIHIGLTFKTLTATKRRENIMSPLSSTDRINVLYVLTVKNQSINQITVLANLKFLMPKWAFTREI
jgi:hypothetical protein